MATRVEECPCGEDASSCSDCGEFHCADDECDNQTPRCRDSIRARAEDDAAEAQFESMRDDRD